MLEKFPKAKFDESLEIHIKLAIDAKKGEQQIKGTAVLPHGTGKTIRIAAFTEIQQKEAQAAGADIVGGEELVNEIAKKEELNFDVAVATPEMMPKLAKIAKILGPKGLMPNAKTQTVGTQITNLIKDLKKGKVSFKNDKGGNLHQLLGKTSFGKDKLKENTEEFLKELQTAKPTVIKGKLIKKAFLSTTMSPAVRIKV